MGPLVGPWTRQLASRDEFSLPEKFYKNLHRSRFLCTGKSNTHHVLTKLDHAQDAQHVAAGLNKVLGPVPERKVDITALIAKCFEVSSSLHNLAEAVEDSRSSVTYKRISVDVHDVVHSLDHTFKDVHQIVGEGFADAKKAKLSQSTAYRKVWRNIEDHFRRESGNALTRRLEY